MGLHRFIGEYNLNRKHIKVYDKSVVKQIRKVLRLNLGDKVIFCDGRGNEALSEIIGFIKDGIEFKVIKKAEKKMGSGSEVFLFCSILKRDRFELVVQKATEIGVSMIIPMLCKRTVKKNVKYERLEKIIREAAEQSGRSELPRLEEVMTFDEATNVIKNVAANFLLDMTGDSNKASVKEKKEVSLGVWVGPEGGWEKSELEKAESLNFEIVNLGKSVLRSETAAIIASYLGVNSLLG